MELPVCYRIDLENLKEFKETIGDLIGLKMQNTVMLCAFVEQFSKKHFPDSKVKPFISFNYKGIDFLGVDVVFTTNKQLNRFKLKFPELYRDSTLKRFYYEEL